jgi:hypothetical protein
MRYARAIAAAVLAVGLLALTPVPTATAGRAPVADASVIADWNKIAVDTIAGDTSVPVKAPIEVYLYTGFMHAAVYNAVVGIEGGYRPYRFHEHAPRGASSQAAAVAAAYTVLLNYSPAKKAFLDEKYAASLAAIDDGPAKDKGIAFGQLAAADLIADRVGDGRNANITFTPTDPTAPGVWRPTPPANAPFSDPWLGYVRPMLITSGAQFDPGPQPALTSRRYTQDFNEVKDYGSSTSTKRTAAMSATGVFWAGNPVVQLTAGLRDQAAKRHLDIVDSARMFAAVHMSLADASIAIWWTKHHYGFWRPITAIQLAGDDKNPDTVADATWAPFISVTPAVPPATPPYPDYVSGYNGVVGAYTQALQDSLGTRHLDLTLTSTASPGEVRTYDRGREVRREVIDARVWLGLHFRFADTAAARMGQQVAGYGLDHYFGPAKACRSHR